MPFTFSSLGGVNIVRKKSGLFDQTEYTNTYQKKHYKRVTVLVPYEKSDVIKKLDQVNSKSAYILDLIEKDINK